MTIGSGNLDTKVPEIKTDKELELLNKNFNLMIERLKTQQDKLLISERHEAWESVARKLAHEIVDKDPGLKNHSLIKKCVLAEYNHKVESLN